MFIPPDLMSVATSPRSPKVAAQTRCPKPGRRGWAAWPRPRHTEPANAVRSESVVSVRECESLAYLQLARRRRIVFNLAPTLSTCATPLADFSEMHRKIEKNVIHSLASPSYKLEASKEYSTQAPGSADAKPFRWAASEPARPGALGNDHLKTRN